MVPRLIRWCWLVAYEGFYLRFCVGFGAGDQWPRGFQVHLVLWVRLSCPWLDVRGWAPAFDISDLLLEIRVEIPRTPQWPMRHRGRPYADPL